MYGPPKLMPADLAELIFRMGGERKAARLLGVNRETLTKWEQNERVPQMVLRLLWYGGPDGRAEAHRDIENELRVIAAERDALASESQRRAALLDERRASLAARVKALEYENEELRRLLGSATIAADLRAVRSIVDRLLAALEGGEAAVRQ
jgi:transcriptional regulator with XRE-family HTH domain